MSWWSYIQLAVLAALALAGSSVQVHHIDFAFRYDGDLEINLDPVFLVETDPKTARLFTGRPVRGFAFGNVAVVCRGLNHKFHSYVIAHELTHGLQFRALGPSYFLFYAINPRFFEPHLTKNQVRSLLELPAYQREEVRYPMLIDSMWTPPSGWPSFGHFLSSVRMHIK